MQIKRNHQTIKKRMINFRSKLIDKSKSQEKNVQIGLEPFFDRLSQNKKDKDILLNNIRLKSVEKENLEIKRSPKILPYSLLIIKNKYDKSALYQPNQTKEKYIEKDAKYFSGLSFSPQCLVIKLGFFSIRLKKPVYSFVSIFSVRTASPVSCPRNRKVR